MYSTSKLKIQPTIKLKNKDELMRVIKKVIKRAGTQCDLNFIDVSDIDDFSELFLNSRFNGDISRWDVSNATNMYRMFENSVFNGDISQWDVSHVLCMKQMLSLGQFNGDISRWNVVRVKDFKQMFYDGEFKGDISIWPIQPNAYIGTMFSSKQSKVDTNACIYHWRLAEIDVNNVSPSLREFHEKHASIVHGLLSDPIERAYLFQDLWLQERARIGSPHAHIAISLDVFE